MRSLAEGVLWGVVMLGVLMWGIDHGKRIGIAEGRSMALSTNPVSEELDLVCAGLWVGEQNKKYYEKSKEK